MQQDLLHRYIFENHDVRGELVQLDKTYSDIIENHNYPPQVKELIGELLVASCLLSATLKFEGDIAVQLQGDGPVKYAVINGDHQQNMRGIARIQGEIKEGGVLNLIGKGHMVITITPSKGERYQGIVPLESNNLAECLEQYFVQSEQLSTRLWFNTDEVNEKCAGMLLQVLPVNKEKAEADFTHLEALTNTITDIEMLNLDSHTVLTRLYHEDNPRLFEPQPVRFKCTCSRSKIEEALVNVGKEALLEDIQEKGVIKINCQYCLKEYQFNKRDIVNIFN
jgi:molecular chaperone Hsp33